MQATDEAGFPAIAYEFVKEALLLYESEISDSKVQVQVKRKKRNTIYTCLVPSASAHKVSLLISPFFLSLAHLLHKHYPTTTLTTILHKTSLLPYPILFYSAQALTEVIGTLLNCQNFPTEDYEALIHKVSKRVVYR